MAKEFVIKHGLIVHGEITGSDVRIDDWNSISASLAELNSNVSETVTTASIVGNVITFTKSDGTTFDTVVQEDTGSFFTSASVDLNTITFHYADNTSGSLSVETGTTLIRVKNTSGGAISKGTPVYITGNVGATDMLEIAPADASDASKMPAVGLLLTDLGINGEGFVVQGGYLTGMTTDVIDGTSTSSNNTVYVKAGGGLTMTKPTGDTNYIQNIAKVARVHGTAGSFIVSSILRTNDIPNLPTGKIWVGDGNTVTSSFVHLDETNQRMGIGTDTPLKPLHIENESVPIRLESDTHNAVVVNYRTDEVGTGNGIQVGARGASDFFVQQDVVSGGSSQWNVNVYVSQSGKVYLPNLDGGLDDQILYYNNETGELKPGAQPSTGSFFTSASVDYNRVTFTSGDGTTATITIDTGSFEPDRQDTGSFFTSASVDLNRITFTQGDGTTEVITVHTGSKATPAGSDRELQFNHEGSFGASQYLRYTGKRLDIDSQNSAPALRLSASLNDAVNINLRAQNTVNNGIQVGSRGTNDFFVQQDSTVDNNPSQWNVNLYISQSGQVYLGNLANQTTTSQLYYNAATKEVTSGPLPAGADTGSFYISSSVDLNRITFTQGDGTTEVLTIDTGSAATTDISALNTFTGSIQTEVDNLKTATGSYYVSSSVSLDNLRLFQADGTSVSHDLYDPRNYVSSSVDLNRITFTQRDGSTEVVTVHTGSGLTGNGSIGQIALWDATKRLNGDSHFTWDPLNNRMGINVSSPNAHIHIGAQGSEPIRLDGTVNNRSELYIRTITDASTNNGLRFGNSGDDIFVVERHNGTDWDTHFKVENDGGVFAGNLASATTSDTVYYNSTTGELSYGTAPGGGSGIALTDLSVQIGSLSPSGSLSYDNTTGVFTFNPATISGGGGSGTVNSGVAGYVAYYPSTGTTVDDTSGLYWDGSKLGINTTTPAAALNINGYGTPIVLDSSTHETMFTRLVNQYSRNRGIRLGNQGTSYQADNFAVEADLSNPGNAANWSEVFRVSGSGEMFAANLATATTANTLYYNTTTKEITYGSAPSGGTDTTIYSTNGTLSGNRTLTGGGNSLTFSGLSSVDLNADATQLRGQIYIAESSNSQVFITNATKSDVLYYDSTTGEVTYGTAPGGGSGTPGGSTTQVQFNDAGSFGGDAGLVYDKTNDRLGIGGTGTPANTLHLAGDSEAVHLDGSTASQASQYLRISTNGASGEDFRLGVGYSSPNNIFSIDTYNGSSWDQHFKIDETGYIEMPSLQSNTTSNVVYYDTTFGRLTYGAAPSGGGTPGGSNSHVQFNNNGSFDGSADLRWDSSTGRLGIGVPSADSIEAALHLDGYGIPIQLSGAGSAWIRARTSSTPTGQSGIRFGAAGGGAVDEFTVQRNVSGTTWTEVFSVENNGVTNIANTLRVNGGAYIGGTTNPSSGKLQVNGDLSGVSVYGSHDIVAYSDARSKVNVETIPNALEKVNAVRGVTYNKVEDPEGIRYMGVIAQELLEHLPEVVRGSEESTYSVAYGNVVGVLIEAIKELTAKVEDLESRLGK